jgi:hypothetical protein
MQRVMVQNSSTLWPPADSRVSTWHGTRRARARARVAGAHTREVGAVAASRVQAMRMHSL